MRSASYDLYADWARVYDFFYGDRSAEVDFWARLLAPFGHLGLDAMCGTAEVSLGLARQGFRVVGADLSPAMLQVAHDRLAAAADYPAQSLALVMGDVCALPLADSTFDWAIVGGNGSFNHLDQDQALAALIGIRRLLRDGGSLALELVNPHLLKEIYPERTYGPFRATPPGVWVERVTSNRYDSQTGLFHISQVTRCRIEGKTYRSRESFALHAWQPEEVVSMLAQGGFHDARLYGDYDLTPFDRWSSDLIVLAHALPASRSHGRVP
jgi:SAM-dependent methyltransferase